MVRFDIPHMGHAIFLYHARSLGDCLGVGLSSDEYAKSQGKKTIFSYKERESILLQYPFVTYVYKNDSADMMRAILKNEANIVVIGSDWGDRYFKQIGCDKIWFAKKNIELVYIPYTREISTSKIKNKFL